MATYNPASLPVFTSVESMAIWAACVLQELNATTKVTEDVARAPELVAQVQGFDLAIPTDSTWTYTIDRRAIIRLSLPLTASWKKVPLWKAANQLATTATPTDFYTL